MPPPPKGIFGTQMGVSESWGWRPVVLVPSYIGYCLGLTCLYMGGSHRARLFLAKRPMWSIYWYRHMGARYPATFLTSYQGGDLVWSWINIF